MKIPVPLNCRLFSCVVLQISAVSAPENSASEWRSERLQSSTTTSDPAMATEVNPSLYEELKLGHDGVGFKRLVS